MADEDLPETDEGAALHPVVASVSASIGRYLAHQVYANKQRYPDLTDPKDPRWFEPPPDTREPAPQWVYFMADADTGLIKIGTSIEIKTRLRAVARKVGRRVALAGAVRGGFAEETAFHRLLASHRAHGEWFRRGPWYAEVLVALDRREDAEAILGRLTAMEARDG